MDKHFEVDLKSLQMPRDRQFAKWDHIKTYEMDMIGNRSRRIANNYDEFLGC